MHFSNPNQQRVIDHIFTVSIGGKYTSALVELLYRLEGKSRLTYAY